MGVFEPPKFAYMIPTRNGKVIEDHHDKAGFIQVYKINGEDVELFKEHFDQFGTVFVAIFSMQDMTDAEIFKTARLEKMVRDK